MCFIVNGMSSVRESLNTTFLKLYLMQTSRKQISMFTKEEFQSCQAASLVNPTQVLESDSEKRTNATCGPKCLEQLERFNHVGSWAKMFSALLIGMEGWYSKRCKLTWKLKGTKSNRLYFQLQASTLPTEEIEFGSLLTPTSVMTDEPPEKMRERAERNGYKNGTQYGSLLSQVKYSGMLPTPTTQDYKRRGPNSKQQGISNTENWVGMLPTPTASDYFALDKTSAERKARGEKRPSGATIGSKLGQDKRITDHIKDGKTSQLNPQFVEEMMGFPENWTLSPFQSGETNPSKPTETP